MPKKDTLLVSLIHGVSVVPRETAGGNLPEKHLQAVLAAPT